MKEVDEFNNDYYIPPENDNEQSRVSSVNRGQEEESRPNSNRFFACRPKCQASIAITAPSIVSLGTGVPLFLFGFLGAWPAIGVSAGAGAVTVLLEVVWASYNNSKTLSALNDELTTSVTNNKEGPSIDSEEEDESFKRKRRPKPEDEDRDWVEVPLGP